MDGIDSWNPGTRPKYMSELTRNKVSTILKARTRMIEVKNNFRNKYPDVICRACGEAEETQLHVLEEYQAIHQTEETKVSQPEIFKTDPKQQEKYTLN